jgi:hypothetical protein
MPVPTDAEMETLRIRLRNAIDANYFEVLAAEIDGRPVIGEDGQETLVRLYLESPAAAATFVAGIHAYAREREWDAERIRSTLNFRVFLDEARHRSRRERERTTQARAVARGMMVINGGRGRRASPQPPAEDITGDMSPGQMVESDSLFLIAVGTLLQRRRGRVWFDTFHKRYITNWSGRTDDTVVAESSRTDSFDLNVYSWLQQVDPRLSKMGDRMSANALSHVADQDQRNEAADWLNSLTWDGVDRLTTLLPEAFKTEDDDYHRAVGRCWFISMAARALEPGCKVDTMPVFMGAQGRQKSQALEIIGGKWYRTAASNVDSANFLQEIQGCLVFEIQELHSIITAKQGAAKVKAVLSTRIDHFRVPYGRHVGEHRRTAVLAGTTNERGWHTDNTGGRRFWPVVCPDHIDLEWLTRNRDQLFAEAVALYRDHTPWWNVPEEEQARRMEAERHVDPWEEILAQRLSDPALYNGWNDGVRLLSGDGGISETADYGTLVTTQRIAGQWLHLSPEQSSRWSRKLADVMRGLGWEKRRGRVEDRSNPIMYWIRSEQPPESEAPARLEPVSARLDDDIPF